jgi:hypothetical protein
LVVAGRSGKQIHLLMNNNIKILYTSWLREYSYVIRYNETPV